MLPRIVKRSSVLVCRGLNNLTISSVCLVCLPAYLEYGIPRAKCVFLLTLIYFGENLKNKIFILPLLSNVRVHLFLNIFFTFIQLIAGHC